MVSSDIRKEARTSLKGKWGKGVLIALVYTLIVYAMQWVANLIPVVGAILLLIIEVPIAYGIVVVFMKLKRGEEVSVVDFLKEGFAEFKKTWSVTWNTIKKLIVPFILVIVFAMLGGFGTVMTLMGSGVGAVISVIGWIGYIVAIIYMSVKSLYYSLSMYILKDNNELTGKEIVEKSAELMNGNRWNYFWLLLTFSGWAILACFTLGIGMFWLLPYIQVAQIIFYEDKAGILNKTEEVEVIEEN